MQANTGVSSMIGPIGQSAVGHQHVRTVQYNPKHHKLVVAPEKENSVYGKLS